MLLVNNNGKILILTDETAETLPCLLSSLVRMVGEAAAASDTTGFPGEHIANVCRLIDCMLPTDRQLILTPATNAPIT